MTDLAPPTLGIHHHQPYFAPSLGWLKGNDGPQAVMELLWLKIIPKVTCCSRQDKRTGPACEAEPVE